MYSRKSHGYSPCTPPPNYNGVAFTRDFRPGTEISEKTSQNRQTPDECQCDELSIPETDSSEIWEDPEESKPCTHESTEASASCENDSGSADPQPSRELTIEDLLIIGAVLLFVSGEFDGDIMLLLGLLLIAGV